MANPIMNGALPGDPKSPSSGDTSSSAKYENYPAHRYNQMSSSRAGGDTLKFSKNMLDFDYGDEDGDADETPTEAEPPLSSTLSKIEMEQRAKKQSNEDISSNKMDTSLNQDPVLERWNRILKGEISVSEQPTFNNNYLTTHHRSRSRSPPATAQKPQQLQHPSISQQHGQAISTSKEREIRKSSSDKASKSRQGSSKDGSERPSTERERKGLPRMRDLHLTVCSSTLWLGHVPRTVTEADISDAFGEFGTINSIDLIPPRGCAYLCMDRRQDAKRALRESRHLKLNGSHIRMAWAPGKGLKEHKKLKDFWEADVGASYIPYSKIDDMIDFDRLEEGGVIDEESMSMNMRRQREQRGQDKGSGDSKESASSSTSSEPKLPELPIFSQPPPSAATSSASIPPFPIPPPHLALGIPPPLLIGGQGVIPFPPPGLNLTSSSSHILLPPPPIFAQSSSDSSEPRDHEMSMTERQIGMLDRQLSMLQQGQTLGHQNPALFFHPNQPNPMIFDLRPQHPHIIHPMLDPQLAMFDGQPHPLLLAGQHPFLTPLNQAGLLDLSNMDENFIKQEHRDF